MLTKEEIKQNKRYFNFLEALRQSGITNMFGAARYLETAFPTITHQEAENILLTWMQNYDQLRTELGWTR